MQRRALLVRLAGPVVFLLALAFIRPVGLPYPARVALATLLWMALWWIAEAVPLAVTALLPLLVFPLAAGVGFAEVAAPYANKIIFLFLGGFLLAAAMEKTGLHRRIAFGIVRRVGQSPRRLVIGFLLAAATLSMWLSNTATTLLLLPIAIAASESTQGSSKALLLALAYGASIGGMGTLIGTPTNSIFAGIVEVQLGVTVAFADFLLVGLPVMGLLLAGAWLVLTRLAFRLPDGAAVAVVPTLPSLSAAEKRFAVVFLLVILGWVLRPYVLQRWLPGLEDAHLALAGAVVLFALPNGAGAPLLDWPTALKIPWGILLLFGGGLSLAGMVASTGLTVWLAEQLTAVQVWPLPLVVLLVILSVNLLTEVATNVATVTLVLPLLLALAAGMGAPPDGLAVGATFAASCAFMLPVATAPNALVFASGGLQVRDMVRAGAWLNALAVLVIWLVTQFWLPLVWQLA